jgi:phage gp46-like protein
MIDDRQRSAVGSQLVAKLRRLKQLERQRRQHATSSAAFQSLSEEIHRTSVEVVALVRQLDAADVET